jgi:polysaccharide pyruvyl transferase WcaK-like protein
MQPRYDEEICRAVARDSGGITVENITAKELAGLAVGAEFVLGMRLHIIVYAAACGIPPIAISYDPKITSMMEYLGETHIVNVFDASSETLMPMVEDVLANRMVYRAKLARRAVELRHLAGEDVATAIRLLAKK